jgi:hypothetical protein
LPPVDESSDNNEEDATPLGLSSGDYARFHRKEEEAVRQVRLYEASQREAGVHRMEQEIV